MGLRAWVLDMYMAGNRAWLSGLCSTARCCFRCHISVQKTKWERERERQQQWELFIWHFWVLRFAWPLNCEEHKRRPIAFEQHSGRWRCAGMGWDGMGWHCCYKLKRKTLAARFWWASRLAAKNNTFNQAETVEQTLGWAVLEIASLEQRYLSNNCFLIFN